MKSVSGLDFNDHESRRLLDTMMGVMREFVDDIPSRGHGGTVGVRSVSTQASSASLTV